MATAIKINESRERSDSLKKLQNYGKSTNTVTNVVNGIKFVGKIKLIQHADSPKQRPSTTANKINMADELSYTQHMKESVAQRANIFTEAEQEYSKEKQNELRKATTKLHKQVLKDEQSRIESLKLKALLKDSNEPDYIAKERQMYDKVEEAFLQHQNKKVLPLVNNHFSNDSQSEGFVQHHVTEDDQSDDSGVAGDADSLCDKERDLIDQTEEMFQKFALLHKQSTASNLLSQAKTKMTGESKSLTNPTNLLGDVKHTKTDFIRESNVSANDGFVRDSLLVRLQIAERNALTSKENYVSLKYEGRLDDALDAEESYHAFSLEVSKLKKKIIQTEKQLDATSKSRSDNHLSTKTTNREFNLSQPTKRIGNELGIDKTSYNDDGDCVPEGIINNRLQMYQSS